MRKLLLTAGLSLSILSFFLMHSCAKSIADGYTEPITLLQPDTLLLTNVHPGSVQPIQIQFTTDRPILYANCMYEIDSPGAAALASYRTYPDTLFYIILDTIASKLNNKYSYTGSFTVPATLSYVDTVRFDIQFKAALNPSSTDTISYSKQFKMIVL